MFSGLAAQGLLVADKSNPDYLKNRFKHLSVLQEHSHLSQHDPDCLAARLCMTGFSKVRVYGSGRVSMFVGQRFPVLSLYGSYLICGDKR
jgi:hypothetical protein